MAAKYSDPAAAKASAIATRVDIKCLRMRKGVLASVYAKSGMEQAGA